MSFTMTNYIYPVTILKMFLHWSVYFITQTGVFVVNICLLLFYYVTQVTFLVFLVI